MYPKYCWSRHAQLSTCYVTSVGTDNVLIFVEIQFLWRNLCSLCNIWTRQNKVASPVLQHMSSKHFICNANKFYCGCPAAQRREDSMNVISAFCLTTHQLSSAAVDTSWDANSHQVVLEHPPSWSVAGHESWMNAQIKYLQMCNNSFLWRLTSSVWKRPKKVLHTLTSTV